MKVRSMVECFNTESVVIKERYLIGIRHPVANARFGQKVVDEDVTGFVWCREASDGMVLAFYKEVARADVREESKRKKKKNSLSH